MRSTLFYIPHADPWLQIPLFGFGWLLGLWAVVTLALLVRVIRSGKLHEKWDVVVVQALLGLLVYVVAPKLEHGTASGVPLGIPVRAYGVLVLSGILAGGALILREARRMGVNPDTVFALLFAIVVCGFIGARVFYVIEYWDEKFVRATWSATLWEVVRLTEGGLVVYGSFIGASLAAGIFLWKYRLPWLAIADLIAPGMILGVALGRIGCLMNGCCWGGLCEEGHMAITFPQGSPPFVDHLERGLLLGMNLERTAGQAGAIIRSVAPGSQADQHGFVVGQRIMRIDLPDAEAFNRMRRGENVERARVTVARLGQPTVSWEFGQLPRRSRPVYPSQILSAINAGLICLFLYAYYPFRRHDGELLALLVTIYPITRILLEMVRSDEPSLLSADFRLTISQAMSGLFLLLVIGLWIYILKRPRGSVLPRQPQS